MTKPDGSSQREGPLTTISPHSPGVSPHGRIAGRSCLSVSSLWLWGLDLKSLVRSVHSLGQGRGTTSGHSCRVGSAVHDVQNRRHP